MSLAFFSSLGWWDTPAGDPGKGWREEKREARLVLPPAPSPQGLGPQSQLGAFSSPAPGSSSTVSHMGN